MSKSKKSIIFVLIASSNRLISMLFSRRYWGSDAALSEAVRTWGPPAWASPETQETAAARWADYATAAVLAEEANTFFFWPETRPLLLAWAHSYIPNPAAETWIEASAVEAARIAVGGLECPTW
ncbi:hypothetical protein K438DRAFT_1956653 [Mycena galopus ATCC 62051]|nr:hypothetical protein K438DRAFT_1956653 [Mycena galopus ATCC 62051]